jgi:hypothetical protein
VGNVLKASAAFLLASLLAMPAAAHDIPADVIVQTFVRPEGRSLQVLVRVPLKAMRDVNFPLRGPGYLDLANADTFLRDAAMTWIAATLEFYEGDAPLGAPRLIAARASIPSDRSFASFDTALRQVRGPRLPSNTDIAWDQAMLDVLFDYPVSSDLSRFSIRPAFARLGSRVVTVVRFLEPGHAERAFEFTGDPGLVRLDPQWYQAVRRFVALGFVHILDGTDHLLFLLCLIIPVRRIRPLVLIVTAFTIAHSVTLTASAWNLAPTGLWFPPLVETLIAASIVYMALENIVISAGTAMPAAASGRELRRWSLAFAFGLVHGFGFSFALRESLQFAGSHLLTSLFSFNAGVELGQLAVLAVMVPALRLLFRFVVDERIGTIVLSALVAHTAWHWTAERWDRLRQFHWPSVDVTLLAPVLRMATLLVLAAGVAWALRNALARRADRARLAERQERSV